MMLDVVLPNTGTPGPEGPAGATGATGPAGPAGSTAIAFPFGDGVNDIPAGSKLSVKLPYAGTIQEWTVLADVGSGTVTLDVWKRAFADGMPSVTHTITASAKPAISPAGVKASSSTLTGWTTTFAAADIVTVNIDACEDIQQLTFLLKVLRSE